MFYRNKGKGELEKLQETVDELTKYVQGLDRRIPEAIEKALRKAMVTPARPRGRPKGSKNAKNG